MRKNQLNSNSTLFLQLGILFSLVLVYSLFELQFSRTVFTLPDKTAHLEEPDIFVFPPFQIEKQKIPEKKIKIKLPTLLTKFTLDESNEPSKDTGFILKEPSKPVDYDSIFSDVPIIEDEDEIIPFVLVEQAPRYPGCKGKTEEEYKKCFNKKIKKFVAKKFNPNTELNLSGKQRINVQFEIDKNGDIVNVKARGPHKRLEKEAIKTIKKLPKMEPAKQRNRKVGVRYTLPILLYLN